MPQSRFLKKKDLLKTPKENNWRIPSWTREIIHLPEHDSRIWYKSFPAVPFISGEHRVDSHKFRCQFCHVDKIFLNGPLIVVILVGDRRRIRKNPCFITFPFTILQHTHTQRRSCPETIRCATKLSLRPSFLWGENVCSIIPNVQVFNLVHSHRNEWWHVLSGEESLHIYLPPQPLDKFSFRLLNFRHHRLGLWKGRWWCGT